MHSHFWPDSFIKAGLAGEEWYGWKLETDASGARVLSGEGGGPYSVLGFREVDLAEPPADTEAMIALAAEVAASAPIRQILDS